MAQAPCNFLDAGRNHSGHVGSRHWDLGREPGKGVSDLISLGGPNVGTIAAVAIKSRTDVPAVDAMSSPGGALMRLFVDNNVDIPGGVMGVRLKSKLL
jgi:hypothetical protein